MELVRSITETNAAANSARCIVMENQHAAARMMHQNSDPDDPLIRPPGAHYLYNPAPFQPRMVNVELDDV